MLGDRITAAHHEAGHAVASVMRGGSSLTSVSLSDTTHGQGITWSRHKACDAGFITWAGPWAEARHEWSDRPMSIEDEDGCEFNDYVFGVLMEQPDDLAVVRAEWQQHGNAGAEAIWHDEMVAVWPAVQQVAGLLLDGHPVTDAVVRALVETCWMCGQRA